MSKESSVKGREVVWCGGGAAGERGSIGGSMKETQRELSLLEPSSTSAAPAEKRERKSLADPRCRLGCLTLPLKRDELDISSLADEHVCARCRMGPSNGASPTGKKMKLSAAARDRSLDPGLPRRLAFLARS